MEFKLIPVYTAEGIFKAWPYISKGLEAVLAHVEGDEDITKVLNEILVGGLTLWLGFVDEKYSGFVTTRMNIEKTNPPFVYLVIPHAYKKKGVREDLTGLALAKLEEFASQEKCKEIRFYSKRGFEKYIKKYGFEPLYTEYRKKVNFNG